jgi:hypothetical protein
VTLSLVPFPPGLPFYTSANWASCFEDPNGILLVESAAYDSGTNRVRVVFNYSKSLQGEQVTLNVSVPQQGPQLANISSVSLALPTSTANNLALYQYEDNVYSFASIARYVTLAIVVLELVLFFSGYFGGKLIALESIAMAQLAALLLLSLEQLGPTFDALRPLVLTLGITILT